ncbi:hypothetical protein SAMN05446037_10241 [Anaerovirgula multivorans]|uniref:Neutral/alkaline non-lysosomal ceramidase, N-terminal n=1 Tax=Anaerovirgula multivorans TaxID=312168 RepID=A0A239HUF4_9FIRM|nr:hypothetical protein [Anaerovirgula multivorans]SNS84956.1 hypothetical protein SAMN05446037_10241 [Anaerovirgula multivorans]
MNNIYNFKAAFAQADITPDFQVELIGCYREDSKSQGVLHSLYAQVLILEFGGRNYCLIAIDSLGLTTTLSDELRSIVSKQLKTDISCVMLCFSHTHSAPTPLSPVNGERYFHLMCDRIQKCVIEAKKRLKPCKTGWAMTDTEIGENRREGCTMVDNRIGALKIADSATGCPLVVVLRITAHANILMSCNNKISSDYFGVAREKLQDCFLCPVILIQGAAGNIKPAGVEKILGGNIPDLDRISDILLNSAKQLHFNMTEVDNLHMYSKKFDYYSDVPSEEESKQIADDAKKSCGIDGSEWLRECERLRNSGVTKQVQEGKIQFFNLNGGCFCGIPDEIFCEISLEASKQAHAPYLFLNGYTNGCTGYLPHSQEWVKGGYETLYSYLQYYQFHGHVMPFQKDTADRLVKLVLSEWEHMHM